MSTVVATPRMESGVPVGRQGMWWFLGSEIITFGGALAVYVLMRIRHEDWGEAASHTLTIAGAVNTVVLLSSSLAVVLAHLASLRGDGKAAARWLLTTLALGVAFLGIKSYEYSHEIAEGFTPTAGLFWSFYFFLTGLHALHVIAGLIAMTVVALGAARGRNLQRVEVVGLYWHFVDIVWIFLFPLLYVSK